MISLPLLWLCSAAVTSAARDLASGDASHRNSAAEGLRQRGCVGCHFRRSSSVCEQYFRQDETKWLRHTGGNTDHFPTEHSGSAKTWTSNQGAWRTHQNQEVVDCSKIGGAMWEVELLHWGFTACAPANCTSQEVEHGVARRFLTLLAKRQVGLPLSEEEALSVPLRAIRKLGAWSWMPLDFAIVGVNGCGTTTIFRTLIQHPGIMFTSHEEDESLYRRNLLPTMEFIDGLRKKKELALAEGRTLLGIDNPVDWQHDSVVAAYALVPNIKIIVVLGDPIRVFEKYWMRTFMQAESSGEKLPETELPRVARKLTQAGGGLWAAHMQRLLRAFGDRFFAVHQSQLRASTRAVFQYLLKGLGLEDLAQSQRIGKHNTWSRGGWFCKNLTIVRTLKRVFRKDYEMARQLAARSGLPLHEDISSGKTYCDLTRWECATEYASSPTKSEFWNNHSGGTLTPSSAMHKLAERLQQAEELAERCSAVGGKLWSVNVSWPHEAGIIGICAPRICNSEEVSVGVTHRYLRTRSQVDFPRPFVPVDEKDFTLLRTASRKEVVQWSDMFTFGSSTSFRFLEVYKNSSALEDLDHAQTMFFDLEAEAQVLMDDILPSADLARRMRRRLQELWQERKLDSANSLAPPRLLILSIPSAWGNTGILVFADARWLQERKMSR